MKRKMLKRTLAVMTAAVLLAAGMSGCGSKEQESSGDVVSQGQETETAGENDNANEADVTSGVKIGLSMTSSDTTSSLYQDAFLATCEAEGYEVVITNADGDATKQISDIEDMATKGCDVIVVRAIDSDALVAVVDQCASDGITVLAADFTVNTDSLTTFIDVSQEGVGGAHATYVCSLLEENPDLTLNLGYLWGIDTIVGTQVRYQSFMDGIQSYVDAGRIVVLDEQVTNWDQNEAMNITEDWLQKFPEMNMIVCQSDDLANGTINVLKGANVDFENFYVLGVDATEIGCDNIVNGYQKMTVLMDMEILGTRAAEYAIKAAQGEEIESYIDLSGEACAPVTGENVNEILK